MPLIVSIPLMSRPIKKRLIAVMVTSTLALASTGCDTMRLQSTVELPDQFTAAEAVANEPEIAWWNSYGDVVLSELITRAASENRDIRMAMERVRAARAGVTISRAAMLPNVGAVASASDSGNGFNGTAKQGAPEMQSLSGGLSVSWELDLTGRLRAGAAAAEADAQTSEDQARAVRLLVLTDVASNYFRLTGAMRQLDTVRAIAATQEETLRLVTARHVAGLASPFDVERARTEASRAQASIPPLETLVAVSRHRLAVLMGLAPSATAELTPTKMLVAVPEIQPGQPANLIERRPDLLALKSQLEAANWRRQQASTEWFPRLFVNALFGHQSLEMNGLDLGSARFNNVAGLLSMPIFDWGRTSAINETAESMQSEALLRYEDGIMRALEDVENGLVALRDERNRAQMLQSAAASAQAALGHAESLYERGQIDLLPLLDSQRARLAVQISANDSQTQLLLNSVQLFKALGGGWQFFEPTSSSAVAPAISQTQTSTNEVSS
ncbi:TolC family protein [Shewanella profunda]|uniref:efflux transporter outer membrane subunit n=1 Tax=Shewanella profunda TaxID=254793 RepID=UPI00200CE1A4|nr:TolC family protein [Shewanella profunda]MCL1089104.1 TolC family protein [Shewanella profunda]